MSDNAQTQAQLDHERVQFRKRMEQAQAAPASKKKDSTAIFRRSSFTRHRTGTQRAGAALLWLLSASGAVLWGGGGWPAWASQTPNLLGAALALVLQLIVSWLQVTSSDRRLSLQHIGALAVSSGTTAAGFLPLIFLGAGLWFDVQPWTNPWWAIGAGTVLLAVGADEIPERVLFED